MSSVWNFCRWVAENPSRNLLKCWGARRNNCFRRLTLRSDVDAKISFRHAQKTYFRDAFRFKSDTAVLAFTFFFLFSPLIIIIFCFSCLIFFCCWAFNLVGLILVGKVREAFRILELDERKSTHVHARIGGWCNKIFMEIVRSMLDVSFPFFYGVLDWIVLILDLFNLPKFVDKVLLDH